MTIEGIASVALGFVSQSVLLEAFGFDSAIELFSALVLLWRLRVETGGEANEAHVEGVEAPRSPGLPVTHFTFWPCMFWPVPSSGC